jgi:microcystin-dependent protein
MADPFVAEIRILPTNFAPTGWAFCDGQILPISQNTALFSLLGTTYGGDGKSNFALPNLQGRAALHVGSSPGPGLSLRDLGETGGADTVALIPTEMPAHSHPPVQCNADGGDQNAPGGNLWSLAGAVKGLEMYASAVGSARTMHPNAMGTAGNSQPHNNLPPYLTLNFCIALQGIFPPRS